MDDNNILGCFVSNTVDSELPESEREFAFEQGRLFRTYLWGENGLDKTLKKLPNKKFGKDLIFVLFQFYINPIPYQLEQLKDIEEYRKTEKSIGIPIIITDNNFFDKSDDQRKDFLKQIILEKLDLLEVVIKTKELDTKIKLLKSELEELVNNWN